MLLDVWNLIKKSLQKNMATHLCENKNWSKIAIFNYICNQSCKLKTTVNENFTLRKNKT